MDTHQNVLVSWAALKKTEHRCGGFSHRERILPQSRRPEVRNRGVCGVYDLQSSREQQRLPRGASQAPGRPRAGGRVPPVRAPPVRAPASAWLLLCDCVSLCRIRTPAVGFRATHTEGDFISRSFTKDPHANSLPNKVTFCGVPWA